jgi:hypothetical protein
MSAIIAKKSAKAMLKKETNKTKPTGAKSASKAKVPKSKLLALGDRVKAVGASKKAHGSHLGQSNLMVGESNLESTALYKKLMKLNKADSKKAAEPTILEMSSLSKVNP